jgi:hypothetical protein
MADRGESCSATMHLQQTETDADRQEASRDPAGPRQTERSLTPTVDTNDLGLRQALTDRGRHIAARQKRCQTTVNGAGMSLSQRVRGLCRVFGLDGAPALRTCGGVSDEVRARGLRNWLFSRNQSKDHEHEPG